MAQQGVPFNFSGILDVILVPRCVASDAKLSPGARLMWAVIRQHAWKDGICRASDETLGAALGVTYRQARRYMAELREVDLLQVIQRKGKTPERTLLLTDRFKVKPADLAAAAGKRRTNCEDTTPGVPPYTPDTSVRPPGHICPPPRTEMSALYKERGSSEGSFKGTEQSASCEHSPLKTEPPETPLTGSRTSAAGSDGATLSGRRSKRPTLAQLELARDLAGKLGCTLKEALGQLEPEKAKPEMESAASILGGMFEDQPNGKV